MKTVTKMRLSRETLAILKNFASINSNILIHPGNTLKTISGGSNIYAIAKIQEEFDTEVGIWDLNKFLGIISMFNNPDLEFHDKYVDISNGRSTVKYFYAEKALLTVPTKEVKMPPVSFAFEIDEQDLNEILKASSILQVGDLRIVAADGKIRIVVEDSENDTSDNFDIVVDENYSGQDFDGSFKVSDIKILSGSYKVELTDTIICKFTHSTTNLVYYIAINRD